MSTHRRTVGDTYPLKATITKNGEPVDITGAVGTFNFKKASGAKITIDGTITDGAGGAIEFTPTEHLRKSTLIISIIIGLMKVSAMIEITMTEYEARIIAV